MAVPRVGIPDAITMHQLEHTMASTHPFDWLKRHHRLHTRQVATLDKGLQ
jgi:hypothetical protein